MTIKTACLTIARIMQATPDSCTYYHIDADDIEPVAEQIVEEVETGIDGGAFDAIVAALTLYGEYRSVRDVVSVGDLRECVMTLAPLIQDVNDCSIYYHA